MVFPFFSLEARLHSFFKDVGRREEIGEGRRRRKGRRERRGRAGSLIEEREKGETREERKMKGRKEGACVSSMRDD